MTISEIVEISKMRSKVYIDQEFAFVLYKGELRHFGIKEGEEIAEADYRYILEELLPKRAKLRCMNLLKNREYTRSQLKGKLKQGYYPEAVMEIAMDYVASYHYIDDSKYALDFINYSSEKKSRRRIESDLLNKGMDKATIEKAWSLWEEEGNSQDESTQIEYWMQKKHYNFELTTPKEKQKMYAFLIRKGFSCEKIQRVFRKMGEDDA